MHDSLTGRLADLIVKPGRLMEHVAESPQWLAPLLILFVLTAAFTWLVSPISGPEQWEMMRDSKLMRMMPEDQWQRQYDQALNPSPRTRALSSVGAGIMTFGMALVFGLVLGFFARMSGGTGTYKQALGVTAWASLLPFGLGMVIKAPLILATESMFRVNIGLAAFLPDPVPGSALFQVLQTYGDFLSWWGLAVLVIGFQRTHGLSRSAALVAVLLPWALASAVPLGLALLTM